MLGAMTAPWVVVGIHDLHDVIVVHEQCPQYTLFDMILKGPWFFVLAEWVIAYGVFWIFILPVSAALSRKRFSRGVCDVAAGAIGGIVGISLYCLVPGEWLGLPHSDQPLNWS